MEEEIIGLFKNARKKFINVVNWYNVNIKSINLTNDEKQNMIKLHKLWKKEISMTNAELFDNMKEYHSKLGKIYEHNKTLWLAYIKSCQELRLSFMLLSVNPNDVKNFQ
jgi:hypothetical protein